MSFKTIFKFVDMFYVPTNTGDQSKHRLHTHRYEDMCM